MSKLRTHRRSIWSGIAGKVESRKLLLLKSLANGLFQDFRLTWSQICWWHDEAFNAYLDRFEERNHFNTHRRWMLHQLLRLTDHVRGDTAECGVYKGASSYLICEANRRNTRFQRVHHLFDSFEGLSDPSSIDGTYWTKADLAVPEDVAVGQLAPFASSIRLHKGWIPDRFQDVADRTFAFVHVDVDLYQPTYESIAFFYDRLSDGGVLVCDDYGFMTCPGATRAIDEYLADRPEKMLALDAGGGFFVKGCRVDG